VQYCGTRWHQPVTVTHLYCPSSIRLQTCWMPLVMCMANCWPEDQGQNVFKWTPGLEKPWTKCFRLHSHKHKYESSTVQVPVYEFRQTRVCMYFNGGRSHTYEYGLPVNFTCTSSFYAGHVFIQLVESKLLVNSMNVIYKNRVACLTSRLTSL